MAKSKVWALSLLLGCGGSDTGNPFRDRGEEGNLAGCEVVDSTQLELTSKSELGFSANDVLAYAGGAHSAALRWPMLRQGSYTHEAEPSTLTIDVTPHTAKLVKYANEGGTEEARGCEPQLEIEVDLTLKSSGGALNEQLRTTLLAKRAQLATLRASFTRLEGTLVLTPPTDWTTAAIHFEAQLTPYASSGSFSPVFEQRSSNGDTSVSAGPGNFAEFGLASCAYGVAVPRDATGDASSASTIALLAAHPTASVGATTATLTFEPGDRVCKYFGDALSPYPAPALELDGTLVVKTADGAIDGRWPVVASAAPDANGALTGPVTVQLAQQADVTAASFPQVQTGGYDSSSVSVSFELSASGWSGAAVVYGYKNAVCPPPKVDDMGSSPGCPGADHRELARFELR